MENSTCVGDIVVENVLYATSPLSRVNLFHVLENVTVPNLDHLLIASSISPTVQQIIKNMRLGDLIQNRD